MTQDGCGLSPVRLDAKNDQWKALAPVAADWIAEASTRRLTALSPDSNRLAAAEAPRPSWSRSKSRRLAMQLRRRPGSEATIQSC